MISYFFPEFHFCPSKGENIDKLIFDRNEYAHRLIDFYGIPKKANPKDEMVQSYFDDVGEYVLALLNVSMDRAKN